MEDGRSSVETSGEDDGSKAEGEKIAHQDIWNASLDIVSAVNVVPHCLDHEHTRTGMICKGAWSCKRLYLIIEEKSAISTTMQQSLQL